MQIFFEVTPKNLEKKSIGADISRDLHFSRNSNLKKFFSIGQALDPTYTKIFLEILVSRETEISRNFRAYTFFSREKKSRDFWS